jgi:hypothetical protein
MKAMLALLGLHLCVTGGAAARAVPATPPPQSEPALASLLQRAGVYLAEYERQMSMVVAEEQYMQISVGGGSSPERRILKSDLLVVDLGVAGWFGFRDVLEVNGVPVRDRENRLLALVTSPVPDALVRAKRMADESARFNIGRVVRTINTPTLALRFLRAVEQPRSTWTLGGRKKIEKRDVVELRFEERESRRAIETRDNAAAYGRFWIEPDSGRIVRSELLIDSAGMTAMVTVTFGPVPAIGPWVPLTMEEEYRATPRAGGNVSSVGQAPSRDDFRSFDSSARIEGHATYRNFRTFTVDTNTVIKR